LLRMWHVAGSGRPAARRPAGLGPGRCVFFYLNSDVAPLSLRLAKTDSRAALFFACVRPPPPKNRETDCSTKTKKTFYIALSARRTAHQRTRLRAAGSAAGTLLALVGAPQTLLALGSWLLDSCVGGTGLDEGQASAPGHFGLRRRLRKSRWGLPGARCVFMPQEGGALQ
jgi:hypothetical protein